MVFVISPPPRSGSMNLAVGLWSLKINWPHSVGAGFPRPSASIRRPGGENPPLHWIARLHYFFKGHQPTVRM